MNWSSLFSKSMYGIVVSMLDILGSSCLKVFSCGQRTLSKFLLNLSNALSNSIQMSGDRAGSIIEDGRFFGFAGRNHLFLALESVFIVFFSLNKNTRVEDEEDKRLRICDCQGTTTLDYISLTNRYS